MSTDEFPQFRNINEFRSLSVMDGEKTNPSLHSFWHELHRRPFLIPSINPAVEIFFLLALQNRLASELPYPTAITDYIAKHNPDCVSRERYFHWTVNFHNWCRTEAGKPRMRLGDARRRWSVPGAIANPFPERRSVSRPFQGFDRSIILDDGEGNADLLECFRFECPGEVVRANELADNLNKIVSDSLRSVVVVHSQLFKSSEFAARARRFFADVPADWDGLILAPSPGNEPVDPGIVRLNKPEFLQAFALRDDALRGFVQRFNKGVPIAEIGQWLGETFNIYAPDPPLFASAEIFASRHSPRTFAVVSVRNGPQDLLSHWLTHYRRLGVETLVIGALNGVEIDAPGARIFPYLIPQWNDRSQNQMHVKILQLAGAVRDDWILWTDLDELHEFPAPLPEILAAADQAHIEVITGNFVDRHAIGGELTNAQPEPSLFDQYPVQSQITRKLLGGWTQKVMACRFGCPMGNGHHTAQGAPGVPVGNALDYRVHHFKWRAGLVERLQWGLAHDVFAQTNGWGKEAKLLIETINGNGGTLPVERWE